MRRYNANQGLMAGLIVAFTLFACQEVPENQKPNVLFIMTDQQPISCVGAYGNDLIKTPNLDALAENGHLLQNFYIATFPCSPSRATILSGRFLHNHNVFTNNVLMDPSIPVLGTILSDAGYQTGYFGKAHLGGYMYVGRQGGDGIDYMHAPEDSKDPVGDEINAYWHYQRIESDSGWIPDRKEGGPGEDAPQLGFEDWKGGWRDYKDWLIGAGQLEFAETAGNHDPLQSAPEGQHMYSKLGEEYHMATYFTNETHKFIQDKQKSHQPWAAVLSYFGPHLPVAPPPPWDTLFSLETIPLPENLQDDLSGKPSAQRKTELQYVLGKWREDQYKDYIRRYWGYSGYIDAQIGRIFALLKETNQWENTIIVFTSDHGDMLTGHGMIFKLGSNAYEELFHVPAIIRVPGVQNPGTSVASLTSSVDLLPSILDAAAVEIPYEVDGKSIIPLLKGQLHEHHPFVFAEIHPTGSLGKVIMCRGPRYKYVYHWLSEDVDELYDLQLDPGELKNLYAEGDFKHIVQQMQENIVHWCQETGHRYADLISQKAKSYSGSN